MNFNEAYDASAHHHVISRTEWNGTGRTLSFANGQAFVNEGKNQWPATPADILADDYYIVLPTSSGLPYSIREGIGANNHEESLIYTQGMTAEEAFETALRGVPIRHESWREGHYVGVMPEEPETDYKKWFTESAPFILPEYHESIERLIDQRGWYSIIEIQEKQRSEKNK